MYRTLTAAICCLAAVSSAGASQDRASSAAGVFTQFTGTPRPGCAAGVMRDGKLLWAEGFGYADLARGERITPDTVFNVASVSKHFTAFAILQLEAAGKLSLDDSVRRFVPDLPAYAQPVTVRHLLHHTGGLRDYLLLARFGGIAVSDRLGEADGLRMILRQRTAEFAPGSDYSYSNTGYFLLSEIVQKASGQTMRQYAAKHIFDPIGMSSTSYVDRYPLELPRLARGYTEDGKGGFRIDETGWEMTGDGQVHTNVRDLALWEQNLATGRVGGAALARRMTELGRLNDGTPLSYAMGLRISQHRGMTMIGHSGRWAGYMAHFGRIPAQKLGVAVLCNAVEISPAPLMMRLADIYMSDAGLPPVSDNAPSALLRKQAKADSSALQAGDYANAIGELLELRRDGTGLALIEGGSAKPVIARPERIYAIQRGGATVHLAVPGRNHIVIDENRYAFRRLKPWRPTGLTRYEGDYFSDDAGIGLAVIRQGDRVALKFGRDIVKLRPVTANVFHGGLVGLVSFTGDGDIRLRGPLARDLHFRRARPDQ